MTRRVTAEPGQHKMSLLMVVAALLLMISAALLFTRLKSKPDFDVPPPAAEQSIPAPAAEAPPLPDPPYQPDVTPNPDADFAPATPDAAPRPPHAITPGPIGMGNPPPVRLGEDDVDAEIMPASLSSGGRQDVPSWRQRDGRRAELGSPDRRLASRACDKVVRAGLAH